MTSVHLYVSVATQFFCAAVAQFIQKTAGVQSLEAFLSAASPWLPGLEDTPDGDRRVAASDATLESLWQDFSKRQKDVPKPTIPELARSLVQNSKCGVLSVISSAEGSEGYPSGSIVHYAADEDGKPFFCFSDLAAHTRNLTNDTRVSLLIPETENLSIRYPRVTLKGSVELCETESERLREAFLKKHPGEVYVDFGDFHWYMMKSIMTAQFTDTATNAARVGTATGDQFLNAAPDPVSPFGIFICKHMNEDHAKDNKAMVELMTGFEVETAVMRRVDKLGIELHCTRTGLPPFTCRIPFSRPALVRKDVKTRIIELTVQASKKRRATTEAQTTQ